MTQSLTVPPGTQVKLEDFDPHHGQGDHNKKSALIRIDENAAVTADLGHRLYAENQRSVLLVLQGMDTAGKDGTIRTVMRGINPQNCRVTSFKQPSEEELDHDFLWRIHKATPRRGNFGIFNRSHYEDVLVVRVHKLVSPEVLETRYDVINQFERLLTHGYTKIIKCYLHISKEEQQERLQARLDNPNKRWKFSKADLAERKLWEDYQEAYEVALTRCNTEEAPWHIIPSDRKWNRNLIVSELVRSTLEEMSPQFPAAEEGLDAIIVE